MTSYFAEKTILVTGCCGSVGSELIRQLLTSPIYAPSEIIGVDNNESLLFFQDQQYLNDDRIRFFFADIRDAVSMSNYMCNVNIVFHCAALKHVVLCERSPEQAIMTNIVGR